MSNDSGLYDRHYFVKNRYGKDEKRAAAYRQEQQRIMERIEYTEKRSFGGHVLDVGCGCGDFLACFDDRWHKYGIEPSKYAAGQARKRGIRIVTECYKETMDLVVFRGTLQHIQYPLETLERATSYLKTGGLLVILATPDADSFIYQTFGTLPALEPPKNWVVFGHRNLENILRRLGYKHIEFNWPYLGTPYANPLRDFGKLILSLFFGYRPFAWFGNMLEVYATK